MGLLEQKPLVAFDLKEIVAAFFHNAAGQFALAVQRISGDEFAVQRGRFVQQLRGRGLFAGVELDRNLASTDTVVRRLLQRGVLTRDTHRNTIRFAPPLIIDEAQIDWAIDQLTEVLEETAALIVQA